MLHGFCYQITYDQKDRPRELIVWHSESSTWHQGPGNGELERSVPDKVTFEYEKGVITVRYYSFYEEKNEFLPWARYLGSGSDSAVAGFRYTTDEFNRVFRVEPMDEHGGVTKDRFGNRAYELKYEGANDKIVAITTRQGEASLPDHAWAPFDTVPASPSHRMASHESRRDGVTIAHRFNGGKTKQKVLESQRDD